MPQMSIYYKMMLCRAYGEMRAHCQGGRRAQRSAPEQRAGAHQLSDDEEHLKEYTDWTSVLKTRKDAIEIQWRVVDWGLADKHDETGPAKDEGDIWEPKDPYAPDDEAQHDQSLGTGTRMQLHRRKWTRSSRLFAFRLTWSTA